MYILEITNYNFLLCMRLENTHGTALHSLSLVAQAVQHRNYHYSAYIVSFTLLRKHLRKHLI